MKSIRFTAPPGASERICRRVKTRTYLKHAMSRIEMKLKARLSVLRGALPSLGLVGMLWLAAQMPVCATRGLLSRGNVISFVDHDLKVVQKFCLRVDGKPFYMTNIQVRLDKLRYAWGWDAAAREALIARAAADGFNTVSIPIHWVEVEPEKDKFDGAILDEYLGLALKYQLKVELLWFGQNSGGHVQWLGDPRSNPVHLRTPDYVLYSPKPGASETTSEYKIRRDMSDYSLDLADRRLMEREAYVLGKMMRRIAWWDKANGSKHTVIGVQLGNEVRGRNKKGFPASLIIDYMNELGDAVKNSPYSVWTRMNCVWGDHTSRIEANEKLRAGSGTNIDFIGIDLYTSNPSTIRGILPNKGINYRMIMECGAEVSNAAQLQLAALSGNNAYDHYDMCGPDGHGLYDRSGTVGFTPNGTYIDDVRTVNRLINSANVDIATNAHGNGLYVHNWSGKSAAATTGVDGVNFTPESSSSQALSIRRSDSEIILMSTKGGAFTYPEKLGIHGASKGYFDRDNNWVDEGSVLFTGTSISPEPGVTVRLTRSQTSGAARNRKSEQIQ